MTWSRRVPRDKYGRWGMRMNCDAGGFRTTPPYTGHRPPRMRKSDDFPQPVRWPSASCANLFMRSLTVRTYNQQVLLHSALVVRMKQGYTITRTPGTTWKLRLFTSTSPFGVTIGTFSNSISSDSTTSPRPRKTAETDTLVNK